MLVNLVETTGSKERNQKLRLSGWLPANVFLAIFGSRQRGFCTSQLKRLFIQFLSFLDNAEKIIANTVTLNNNLHNTAPKCLQCHPDYYHRHVKLNLIQSFWSRFLLFNLSSKQNILISSYLEWQVVDIENKFVMKYYKYWFFKSSSVYL